MKDGSGVSEGALWRHGDGMKELGDALDGVERSEGNRVKVGVGVSPGVGAGTVPECFTEVVARRKSKDPVHRQQWAALEAVRLSVVGDGHNADASEFAAAILIAMDRLAVEIAGKREAEDAVELLAGFMFLETLALRDASRVVVRKKGKELLGVFHRVLDSAGESAAGVMRHTAAAIAMVLGVCDPESWALPIVQRSFYRLMTMLCAEHPKVRRRARESLEALFAGPRAKIIVKKSSPAILVFASATMDPQRSSGSVAHFLHVLPLFLRHLHGKNRLALLDAIFKLYETSRLHITKLCLDALGSVFPNREKIPESEVSIIIRLLSTEPGSGAGQEALIAYIKVISSLATHWGFLMSEQDRAKLIMRLVEFCDLFHENNSHGVAHHAISAAEDIASVVAFHNSSLILEEYAKFLSSKFLAYWNNTSKPLSRIVETTPYNLASGPFQKQMSGLLGALLEARLMLQTTNQKHKLSSVDNVLGAALRSGWFPVISKLRPTKLIGETGEICNADLIPLYRDHVQHSKLMDYHRTLMGLEPELGQLEKNLKLAGADIESKNIEFIRRQVIDCFPSFCRKAIDITDAMPNVLPLVKNVLASPDSFWREIGFRSLRHLAESCEFHEENRKDLATLVNRVCSLLVDAVALHPAELRQTASETLTAVMTTCNDKELSTKGIQYALDSVLKEFNALLGQSKLDGLTEAMVAICVAEISPSLNFVCIEPIRNHLVSLIRGPGTECHQKLAYRSLGRLLARKLLPPTEELANNIISCAQFSTPGSSAARLRCLKELVEVIGDREKLEKFARESFIEIALCTRDPSAKAREASFVVLMACARKMRSVLSTCQNPFDESGLITYLQIALAGLAAKNHAMIACTITFISKLIYEFRGEAALSEPLANEIDGVVRSNSGLPGVVPILLRHESLEVVRAALGLLKVLCVSVSPTRLAQLIDPVLPSLLALYTDSRNDVRLRVRFILERFLRKCGDALEKCFPKEHMKLLNNLRKEKDRMKRKSKDRSEAETFDSAFQHRPPPKDTPKADEDDIIETEEFEPEQEIPVLDEDDLDLLDHNLRPTQGHVRNSMKRKGINGVGDMPHHSATQEGFKLSADGRPIFADSDDDMDPNNVDNLVAGEDESDVDAGKLSHENHRIEERAQKRARGGRSGRPKAQLGEEYRNRKGSGGDVKLPGRPDPFAYIPLGASNTSRRNPGARPLRRLMKHGKRAKHG